MLVVQVGHVARGPDLPDSIPPNRTKAVQIAIEPPIDGPERVSFAIVSAGASSGSASIVGDSQFAASGEIEVLDGQQTAAGDAGSLKILAIYQGKPVAHSPPFSVSFRRKAGGPLGAAPRRAT